MIESKFKWVNRQGRTKVKTKITPMIPYVKFIWFPIIKDNNFYFLSKCYVTYDKIEKTTISYYKFSKTGYLKSKFVSDEKYKLKKIIKL